MLDASLDALPSATQKQLQFYKKYKVFDSVRESLCHPFTRYHVKHYDVVRTDPLVGPWHVFTSPG